MLEESTLTLPGELSHTQRKKNRTKREKNWLSASKFGLRKRVNFITTESV